MRLAIVEGRNTGREFVVTGSTVIGSDPGADVVVADSQVAGRHAALDSDNGPLVLRDLGSTGGTFVNGTRVTERRALSPGDRLTLGDTVFEIKTAQDADASPLAQDRKPSRVREIPTLPRLVFTAGQLVGTDVPLGSQVVIGRDPGVADIVLDQDPEISRRHASFSPSAGGLTIEDLASRNGTFVNGQRLIGAVALNQGDRVQIGQTLVEVRLPAETVVEPAVSPRPSSVPQLPPNDIVVENLVKQYGKYRAVDGINLHVEPGEIYGFLGPNGAGKSTTVHVLTTLLPPTSGVARVAGFNVATEGARVRHSIGVALQAAALDPHLNGWEHMALQTALQGIPRSQRKLRAAELLERVKLTDVADRRVGGYSGGMKRRLDLAMALVHTPRVLFLDEPTTGLDPQSRNDLWEEVARLAKDEGTTVFLTTQYLEEADVLADRVGIIDHGDIVAEDTPAALKAQIGRPTLEVMPVDSSRYADVSRVLERFGELTNSASKAVAVRLSPGKEDLADVIRALDGEGLRVMNVELHTPTLDDVFLLKTGRPLEGAAEKPPDESPDALRRLSSAGVPGLPTPTPE